MKKLQFYKQTVLFMGATLALATALALGFTACDKDDDKNSDSDLYVPSKDMDNDEILSLFDEVNANMKEVAEVSIEMMVYEDQTLGGKMVAQVNVSQKKSFTAEYGREGNSLTLGALNYVENFTEYEYTKGYTGDVKRSYKVTDAYWNNFGLELDDLPGAVGVDELQWQVEDNAFVGSVTQYGGTTIKMTMTITTSKKVGSIKVEFIQVEVNPDNEWMISNFTYSANPVLPSGFATSDFPAVTEQRSLKVVWGEGQGENIFYADPDNNSISPRYDILDYAPRVPGKEVQGLYYNSDFSGTAINLSSSIQLNNNNTVLYAKWGSASGSKAAAAKSTERAASKRKFPLGRWLSFGAYQ
jgi:hypothetical protein